MIRDLHAAFRSGCGICGRGSGAMALRGNHYDAAFEAFLRTRRTPYVAVDEQRRTLLEQQSLKSMDFIVLFPRGRQPLGRRERAAVSFGRSRIGASLGKLGDGRGRPGVTQMARRIRKRLSPLLVFAYFHIVSDEERGKFNDLFSFRERTYAFYGVWAEDYKQAMHTRSESWQTVTVPSAAFRELRAPSGDFL